MFWKTLWKNRVWVIGFSVFSTLFFIAQRLPVSYSVVHSNWDDAIPFLPAFVIPYVLWYLYVLIGISYSAVKFPEKNRPFQIYFFSGVFLAVLGFFLFPNCIDFRPSAQGDGFFIFLCRIIFSNDLPRNVFPSLHCYEAVAVHLFLFRRTPLKKAILPRVLSAVLVVLICASTVFIKQHSILDVFAGVGLALLFFVILVLWGNRKEKRS